MKNLQISKPHTIAKYWKELIESGWVSRVGKREVGKFNGGFDYEINANNNPIEVPINGSTEMPKMGNPITPPKCPKTAMPKMGILSNTDSSNIDLSLSSNTDLYPVNSEPSINTSENSFLEASPQAEPKPAKKPPRIPPKPKVSLEDLSVAHIADWLIERRRQGFYTSTNPNEVLEVFKNYCISKGKTYADYTAAYRNAFGWDRFTRANTGGAYRQPPAGKGQQAADAIERAMQILDEQDRTVDAIWNPI
jgi:hypothetical protein